MSDNLVSTFDGNEPGDRRFERPLKFKNEGHYEELDGTVFSGEDESLAYSTSRRLRRWVDKKPEYLPPKLGELLQDTADKLNAAIPMEQWPIGLTGQPEEPWKPVYAVHLLRIRDGALFVLEHDTTGQRICVGQFSEQVEVMRRLRGDVLPIVRLSSKPMKTKFGLRQRPHLEIVAWRQISGDGKPAPQIESPKPPKNRGSSAEPVEIGKPIKPATTEEVLNDKIPF